jgi:hypothetical protein
MNAVRRIVDNMENSHESTTKRKIESTVLNNGKIKYGEKNAHQDSKQIIQIMTPNYILIILRIFFPSIIIT